MKQNCWDVKNCGREPGGANVPEMGVCPATTDTSADGMNSGAKGGRICWQVAGTFCGGVKQGTFADKMTSCMTCAFFQQVRQEEGVGFRLK